MTKYKQNVIIMPIGEPPKIVPGRFFSKMLNKTRYAVLGLGIIAAIALSPNYAKASILPTDSLPADQVKTSAFAKPSGYGNMTGADSASMISDRRPGDVWAATTDSGYLLFFNKDNATPVNVVDMGLPGATGVAYLGNNTFAVSVGKSLNVGSVSGTNWNLANTYTVTGLSSDIKDVSFVNGKYSISADGIRMLNSDFSAGADMGIGSGWEAVKLIDFKNYDTYANRMMQYAQNATNFINIDTSGNPFGSSKNVDLHNSYDIQGIAYYNGGFAVVQAPGVHIHDALNFQNEMVVGNVPEPATCDMNSDGVVNLTDLGILSADWGKVVATESLLNEKTDINDDGVVDITDLSLFAEEWLAGVSA